MVGAKNHSQLTLGGAKVVRKRRATALDDKAKPKKCGRQRALYNDAMSKAEVTRECYPTVHLFRVTRSNIKAKIDNAIAAAFKKTWPTRVKKTAKRELDSFLDLPGSPVPRRYRDDKGEVLQGWPLQVRETKHGNFVIFKWKKPHRKVDKRLAMYHAVPLKHVIDPLPKPALAAS